MLQLYCLLIAVDLQVLIEEYEFHLAIEPFFTDRLRVTPARGLRGYWLDSVIPDARRKCSIFTGFGKSICTII